MVRLTILCLLLPAQGNVATEVVFENKFESAIESGIVVKSKDFAAEAKRCTDRFLRRVQARCAILSLASNSEQVVQLRATFGGGEIDWRSARESYEVGRMHPFPAMRVVKIGSKIVVQSRDGRGVLHRRRIGAEAGADALSPFPSCEIFHMQLVEVFPDLRYKTTDRFMVRAYARCDAVSMINGIRLREYFVEHCGSETVMISLRVDPWFISSDYPLLGLAFDPKLAPPFDSSNPREIGSILSDDRGLRWWTPEGSTDLMP